MCGIVGIVGHQNVAGQLYDGLTVLQHRGQDAAGIATSDGTRLRLHKGNGLVRDVFNTRSMSLLEEAETVGADIFRCASVMRQLEEQGVVCKKSE